MSEFGRKVGTFVSASGAPRLYSERMCLAKAGVGIHVCVPVDSPLTTRIRIMRYPRRSFGFSVVELVMVLSIIAVLLAVALPALGQLRGISGTDVSLNNLANLGVSHALYAADWDGRQFTVSRDGLEERVFYMKEGESYRIVMWESTPIDVSLPPKIALEVTEAEVGVRGDTVTGATKPVMTETGFEVRVPIFIKQGDKILVNTESGDYLERVNE